MTGKPTFGVLSEVSMKWFPVTEPQKDPSKHQTGPRKTATLCSVFSVFELCL